MQLRATRRSTQKFDPTVADVEQKEKQTQHRQYGVSSINVLPTRRTPRQSPRFVSYNPDLPPAAFPTLDSPRLTHEQFHKPATSAGQDSRSSSVTPPHSASPPPSGESPQQRSPTPQYEPVTQGGHVSPSSAPNMVQNNSWSWRDFYPPVSLPEATDYSDFLMFRESSVLNITPQRSSEPQVDCGVLSVNQESRGTSTSTRVDLGALNGPDTALLQRNKELVKKVDNTTEDEWYQAEMFTSEEETPLPVKRHKALGTSRKAPRWEDIPVALQVDLVGSILGQCKSKYDAMRKLQLSDIQMRDYERNEANRADMQDAEDINMQILQTSTMEHIRSGGPTRSKQVTANDYRAILNQSLFSTINVDEDYSTATANDIVKARTYLNFCGLKATILEHWLGVDGRPISSLISNVNKPAEASSRTTDVSEQSKRSALGVTPSALRQQNLDLAMNSPSLRDNSVQASQVTSGTITLPPTTSNQTVNTSGSRHTPAQGPGHLTLIQTAKATKGVRNGLLTSVPLAPGPARVPQALREQSLPVKRRVHGSLGDSESQLSSPSIPHGIDPAIARGHVYNAPVRSIDGLVQPRGRTPYTGSARSTVLTHLPGRSVSQHSSKDMAEPLRSQSHTLSGSLSPDNATVRPVSQMASKSGSPTLMVRPQRPTRNPSSMKRPLVPNFGSVKSNPNTNTDANAGNAIQPTAQSIVNDGTIPFQAPAQSSRSVASDQARTMSNTIAPFHPDNSISSTDIISVSDTAISLLTQPITRNVIASPEHVPVTNITPSSSDGQTLRTKLPPDIRYMRTSNPSRAVMAPMMHTSNTQTHGPPWQSNPPATIHAEISYGQRSTPDTLSHQHPPRISTQSNQPVATGYYPQPSVLESSIHQHPPHTTASVSHIGWAPGRISDAQSVDHINAYGYPPGPHHSVQRNMTMAGSQELSRLSATPRSSTNPIGNMNVIHTQMPEPPTNARTADTSQAAPQSVEDLSQQDAVPAVMSHQMNADTVQYPSPDWNSGDALSPHSTVNQPSSPRNMIWEQSQPPTTRLNSYTGALPPNLAVTSSPMALSSSNMSSHTESHRSGIPIQSLLDCEQATESLMQYQSILSLNQPQPSSTTNPSFRTPASVPEMQQGKFSVNTSVQSTTYTSVIPPRTDASNQGNEGAAPDMVYSDIASKAQTQAKKRSVPTYTGTARPPSAPVVKSRGARNVGTKRKHSSETHTTNAPNAAQTDTASASQSGTARQPRAGPATVKPAAKKRKTMEQIVPRNSSRTIRGAVVNDQQAWAATNKTDSTPAQTSVSEMDRVRIRSSQSSLLDMSTVVPTPQEARNTEGRSDAINPQYPASTEVESEEKMLEKSDTPIGIDEIPQDAANTSIPLPPRTARGQFKTARKKSANTHVYRARNKSSQFQAIVDTAPTNRTDRLISETTTDQPNPAIRNRKKSSGPATIESSGASDVGASAMTTDPVIETTNTIAAAKTRSKSKAVTLMAQKPIAPPSMATTSTRAQSNKDEADATSKSTAKNLRKSNGPSHSSTGLAQSAIGVQGPQEEALAKGTAKPVAPRGRKGAAPIVSTRTTRGRSL